MRTFYFLLTFLFLSMPLCCWAEKQYSEDQKFFDDYYNYVHERGDGFVRDSEYMRYIKGIYRPGLLEKFFICRARIKRVTSVSGSINIEGWSNQNGKEKKLKFLVK
jgi:hypothetical protein